MLLPYYYPLKNGLGFVNFDIQNCECCGCKTIAPNSYSIYEKETVLKELGVKKHPLPKSELGYCTALGVSTCEDCWIPEGVEDT